jgi:hypothetical protein
MVCGQPGLFAGQREYACPAPLTYPAYYLPDFFLPFFVDGGF